MQVHIKSSPSSRGGRPIENHRHRRAAREPVVKPDPDSIPNMNGRTSRAHNRPQGTHENQLNELRSNDSLYAATTTSIATRQHRNGPVRSDARKHDYVAYIVAFHWSNMRAAPPSEPSTDGDPLLREMRLPSLPIMVSHQSDPFQESFQGLGKKVKEFNDTLGELQQLGVSHDIQLPELVLIGDQSAGKSSLMSGLANLELPRSEGTCTRCPLHIRVSRQSDWSCRVFLRREYAYHPPGDRSISEDEVTADDPFFPWRKRDHVQFDEFKTVNDKSEIEDVLRWAQIAILNDGKAHKVFVPGSGAIARSTPIEEAAQNTTAKFSPNIVALEIKGPDFPDLSFYDMPGIFQNTADAGDDYLVSVVANLSRAYVQHQSAIIMCSMPMNSDAENSATFSLVRRCEALNRTIGVLTKADLLPVNGNHLQWLEIMRDKKHRTGLGYFITSRPQDRSLDELKEWETHYFTDSNTTTWPDSFHEFKDRCGVDRLKEFLSERLGEEFAKRLPTVKRDIMKRLSAIKSQLDALPELPANVELEIKSCLMSFADEARNRLDAFNKSMNTLPTNFKECLLAIKPKFVLKDISDLPILEISDDDSDATSVATAQMVTPSNRQKRRGQPLGTTPGKRHQLDSPSNGNSFTTSNNAPTPRQSNNVPQALPEPFAIFSNLGRGFRTLAAVRREVESKMKAGMPHIIPSEVYETLALESIRVWKEPLAAFLEEMVQGLYRELNLALHTSLGKLESRFVFSEATRHIMACIEEHRAIAEASLAQLYSDEQSYLLTYNTEAFSQYLATEMAILKRFRHHLRMHAAKLTVSELVPYEKQSQERLALEAKQRESEIQKIGPDQFEREVEVVAYIRGYYKLAALRFADNCAQNLICRMIPNLRRTISPTLEERLGLRGVDSVGIYERLMEEDEATANQREHLKTEKTKFEKALRSIEVLESNLGEGLPVMPANESLTIDLDDDLDMDDDAMADEV